MLLVADHSFLVTQRWDIRVGTSQGPRTLITFKCLDTSILNTDKNHLITLTVRALNARLFARDKNGPESQVVMASRDRDISGTYHYYQ
jgi:hypothetical protein